MSVSVLANRKFFGLIELGSDGTVLYSRIERDGDEHQHPANVTGRNFFSEVKPFKNIAEFQKCLDNFNRSSQQVSSMPFTCQYDDGPVRVKVLMARMRERSTHDVTKSILVHIRKAL
jgi:hypothetical protein